MFHFGRGTQNMFSASGPLISISSSLAYLIFCFSEDRFSLDHNGEHFESHSVATVNPKPF